MSLVPGQHKLEDLARLIIRNSQNRGDKPTPLQNEALKRMSKRHIVGSGTSTRQIIQFYQPIFDKLFFLESLKGQLRISATGQPTHLVGNYGWVQPDARDAGKANIAVNTLFDDGKMRTLFHIGTRFSQAGYTGHGVAWQDIAYALEKAFKGPTLMDVKLPLGHDISLWTEILQAQSRGKRIDSKRWGLPHLGQKGNRNPGNFGCSTMPPIPGGKMIPVGIGMPGQPFVIYVNGNKVGKMPLQGQPCRMS